MLYGLFVTLFVVICFILILLILVQKTKSSLGLGSIGGSSQLLFGGSGGQDLFQKMTWFLGALFIGGSLVLSLMKSRESHSFKYIKPVSTPVQPVQPSQPVQTESPAASTAQ